jgi:hypothetical protein
VIHEREWVLLKPWQVNIVGYSQFHNLRFQLGARRSLAYDNQFGLTNFSNNCEGSQKLKHTFVTL